MNSMTKPSEYNEDVEIELASSIGETTEVAWIAPADLSYAQWQAIGYTMQQVNRSLNWWLGDWLNEGERRYGETYAQAIEVTDSSVDTLRKYKWVASRVAREDRNKILSWTHHVLVANLEATEHKPLLDLAERFELPTRTFKQFIDLDAGARASVVATAISEEMRTNEFLVLLESFSPEFVNEIKTTTDAPAAARLTSDSAARVGRLASLRPAEIPPDFDEEEESTPEQGGLFDLGPDPFADPPGPQQIDGDEEEDDPDSNDDLAAAWEELGVPLEVIGYDAVSWGKILVAAEIDEDGNPVLAWTLSL